MTIRIRGAILLLLGSCARSPDAWRAELAAPQSDAFDRGLAAIALGAQVDTGLEGVPTALHATLDTPESALVPAASAVLLELPPSALPEMCRCLVDGMFAADPARRALDAAIARQGAAAIPALLDATPDPSTAIDQRIGRITIAIGEPAAGALAAELRPGRRGARAAFLLGALGPRAAGSVDGLLAAATGRDPVLALAAIDSLPLVDPSGREIEATLRGLLADASPQIVAAAEAGLGRILVGRSRKLDPGSEERLALLRDALGLGDGALGSFAEGLWPEGSNVARFSADAILGAALRWSLEGGTRTRSLDAFRAAEKRLRSGTVRVRRTAALEIGRMGRGGIAAVQSLSDALGSRDWGMRFCAAIALASIAVDLGRVP